MNYERLNFLLEQLQEQGDDAFILYGIAMEYYGSDLSKAAEYLERIHRNFPEYIPAYYTLATALDDLNQPEKSLEILDEGIVLAKISKADKTLKELEQYANNLRMELD